MPEAGAVHPTSLLRLVDGLLADQQDEWTKGHRCAGRNVLAKGRMRLSKPTRPAPAARR